MVQELVKNALNARSTAIAVRVSLEKASIHVFDNGYGMDGESVRRIGEINTRTLWYAQKRS